MEKKIYHIEPILKSFVWGGDKLIKQYGLKTELDNVGTIYFVIAESKLDNIVKETGEKLSVFYKNHPELFRCDREMFPVRMTITSNDSYQSYHLHPSDEYALTHEGMRGKVSGSVALFPEENEPRAYKNFGTKAKTLEEFKELVAKKDWDSLFNKIEYTAGEYCHTPDGVIHGGKGNNHILATFGTNSDITYRFYDYDRNDAERVLHLQQTFDCVNIPERDLSNCSRMVEPEVNGGVEIYNYYECDKEYVAKRIKIHGTGKFEINEFYFISCVAGEGMLANEEIKELTTLFIPAGYGEVELSGNMDLILVSYK